ncbi:MAG: DegV family EDD domain-containing protein [Treponema sp.]|nr:DegV family EDD domain-containing protein [Treponema sp.]
MGSFVIVTDSFCELNEKIRKEFEIDFVPGHITFPDGAEKNLNLEWDIFGRDEFYSQIKKNPDIYKTCPANVAEITERFESYAKEGKDILSISISTSISGTYNFTLQAKKAVNEKYPDVKIVCIDTLRYGPAYGLMLIKAAQMRNEGKSVEETGKFLTDNMSSFRQAGWLDDLSFVAKKGRISNSKAFFGQLVGIKPIAEVGENGLPTVIANIKGEKTAMQIELDYIAETIVDPQNQDILICNSMREKQAETYKKLIQERFHPRAIYETEVFAGCGLNMGPGVMCAYYFGKPLSKNLEEERKLIKELIEKKK